MRTVIKLLATFFYTGYMPKARGTLASLAALAVFYFIKGDLRVYVFVMLLLLALGFLVAGRAEEMFKKKDASEITIDEASGMLIALFLLPPTFFYIAGAFILYRLFDIIKIPPAGRIEKLRGSPGIMLDDVVAGVYANVILQVTRLIL